VKSYGIIFDVDGVIADTEAVNAQASIAMFAELFSLLSVKRSDFQAGLGRGAEEYVCAAARVHGLTLTKQQIIAAAEKRQENFLRILAESPLKPYPGVLELIDAGMSRKDFSLAIATSSTRAKSQAVLEATGIPYQQMVYITGDAVTHKKPHPELFLTAASRLNRRPEHCAVIEDAPDGVAAAKAAGCKCIAVTNSTGAENLAEADMVVDSLAGLGISDIVRLIESF
jgi:HAD superfamily hydrolase (TIGR01509 family)